MNILTKDITILENNQPMKGSSPTYFKSKRTVTQDGISMVL